uniref:L1 transposable element RRM domain-containing protein n=1 Tax=Leptobrachium leishanense TaxID=445787 RepID=A0A8C5W7Z5_9ANUR
MGPKKRDKPLVSGPSTPAPTSVSPMRLYLSGAAAPPRVGPESKMVATEEVSGPDSPSPARGGGEDLELKETLKLLPTRYDLEQLFCRLETKFDAKFAELGADVRQLGHRVQGLEDDRETTALQHQHTSALLETQASQMAFLYRWADDLDNRGRRNNIRIRGLPESEGTENLDLIIQTLFNELLQRPPDTPIQLDRAHRALRGRGAPTATPRDVICRVHLFSLKEEVMKAARNSSEVVFNDHTLEIYQDISRATLMARRELKPVTDQLRAHS